VSLLFRSGAMRAPAQSASNKAGKNESSNNPLPVDGLLPLSNHNQHSRGERERTERGVRRTASSTESSMKASSNHSASHQVKQFAAQAVRRFSFSIVGGVNSARSSLPRSSNHSTSSRKSSSSRPPSGPLDKADADSFASGPRDGEFDPLPLHYDISCESSESTCFGDESTPASPSADATATQDRRSGTVPPAKQRRHSLGSFFTMHANSDAQLQGAGHTECRKGGFLNKVGASVYTSAARSLGDWSSLRREAENADVERRSACAEMPRENSSSREKLRSHDAGANKKRKNKAGRKDKTGNDTESWRVMDFLLRECPDVVLPKVLAYAGPRKTLSLYRTCLAWYDTLSPDNDLFWRVYCEELYKVSRPAVLGIFMCTYSHFRFSSCPQWKFGQDEPLNLSWYEFYVANPCVPVDYDTVDKALECASRESGYNPLDVSRLLAEARVRYRLLIQNSGSEFGTTLTSSDAVADPGSRSAAKHPKKHQLKARRRASGEQRPIREKPNYGPTGGKASAVANNATTVNLGSSFIKQYRNVTVWVRPGIHYIRDPITINGVEGQSVRISFVAMNTGVQTNPTLLCAPQIDQGQDGGRSIDVMDSFLERRRLAATSLHRGSQIPLNFGGFASSVLAPNRVYLLSKAAPPNSPLFRVFRGELHIQDISLRHNAYGVDIWNGNAAIHVRANENSELARPTELTSASDPQLLVGEDASILRASSQIEHGALTVAERGDDRLSHQPPAAASVHLSGVEVTSQTGRGIVMLDGCHLVLNDCFIHDCAGTGVYIGGQRICRFSAQNVDVMENGSGNRNGGIGRGHSGLYVERGHVVLRNCNISNNTSSGISVVNGRGSFLDMQETDILSNGGSPLDLPGGHLTTGGVGGNPLFVDEENVLTFAVRRSVVTSNDVLARPVEEGGNRVAVLGTAKPRSYICQISLKRDETEIDSSMSDFHDVYEPWEL
jgi:hypothetical protein